MKKHFTKYLAAWVLALPMAAGAVTIRDLAGCKPGADEPIVTREGLFQVHLACDHLLLEIPDSMYNRDIIPLRQAPWWAIA